MSSELAGRRMELSWNGHYEGSDRILYCAHNAGFFSSCSVALWNLGEVRSAGHAWPRRVDFSEAFSAFRNGIQGGLDLYPLFFQSAPGSTALPERLPFVDHHGLYAFLDYRRINPVVAHYFRPSARALEVQTALKQRYRIDPTRTLAVVYGSTDKGTELQVATPQAYLALTRQLLTRHPEHRLWIQTDERKVRDLFCEAFGERCFFLSEMPVSADGRVIHQQDDSELSMSRSDLGVLLVAVNHLLAQCDLVVNHTGNMALWLCLFRGHARGVWQFDDEGHAVNPQWPGSWLGALRRHWVQLRRRLAG